MRDRSSFFGSVLLCTLALIVCVGAGSLSAADSAPLPDGNSILQVESAAACVLSITCPPDRTVLCHQSTAPSNTGTATFSANPDCGTVSLSHSDATTAGSCPQEYTIARTWTATATSGHVASCIQTINVVDTVPPSFSGTCGTNTNFQCASQVPTPSLGGIGPFDLCDATLRLTSVRTNNGGSGCVGDPLIITDTYTATDDCGNSAQCIRTYTVIDNTPPTISCPANISVPDLASVPPCNPSSASGSDNCGSVTISCSDGPLVGGPCGGTITRTYVASDQCGNTASCDQIITVLGSAPPTIVCPAGFAVECLEDVPPCDPADATASGGCGAIVITCTDGPLVGSECGGTITRTYTATDANNNSASCDQIITIDDNTPPSISCPASITVDCEADVPPCNSSDATATDNCGGVTVTCSDGPLVGGACGGSIVRTFVATDDCGNSASCDQIIIVDDNTPPSISCPASITVECASEVPPCDPADATASDNCGIVTVTCSDAPFVGGNCSGSVIRTFVATDDCGNSASCEQIIVVDDNTAPTISCPSGASVNCIDDIPTCESSGVTATDNCGGEVTITCTDGPLVGGICPGTVTRTYTATDECGNTATCTQVFTVNDVTPPTIVCAPNITVQRFLDLPPCDPADVTASDNCGAAVTVVCTRSGVGGVGCTDDPIPVKYTYTATDACGNTATCQRIVTVLRPDCPFVVAAGDSRGPTEVYPGQQVSLPLNVVEVGTEVASFDLAYSYNRNAVTVLGVDRGVAVSGWEHFSYRLETAPDGSGVIRLIGIADLNNGAAHPSYSAYRPIGELARVNIAVSADPSYTDQSFDLVACLNGCTDNTVTSRSGDMTFVMAESDVEACAASLSGAVLPGVSFEGLRVDIKTPQSVVGDLNLNCLAFEVGDVVLLANYLVNGESALSSDATVRQVQMAASDVNNDGVLASVADLRYLLRVVAGDATPGAKLSPYAATGQAQYRVEDGQLIVSSESNVDLGGAFFIFRTNGVSLGSAHLSNAASGMTVRSNAMGDQYRVLVSPEAGQIAAVGSGRHELLTIPVTGDGALELVEVQMSDARGSLLLTSAFKTVLPTDYALAQNYPNPFNAGTVIPFALKDASEWTVTIYNVMGQVVRSFAGMNDAGEIRVNWDGSDAQGSSVASGVYFYRVQAGTWAATKKMTLVK